MAEELADLDAALAVLVELERRGKGGAGFALGRQVPPGSSLPAYLSSIGLGSNVSTCDGPPFMKRWMTPLGLGGEVRGMRRAADRLTRRWLFGAPRSRVAECERAEAHAAAVEQFAAGEGQVIEVERVWHGSELSRLIHECELVAHQ